MGPPEAFPNDHPIIKSMEIVSFVNNADVIPRTSLFGLELGMRLWIALDSIKSFSFADRMKAVMSGKLPDEVSVSALELLKKTESKSKYKKMVTPGKVVWLVKQEDEIVVSCPEDPLCISDQPMFVGSTWLLDHSLIKYKAALETI